MPKAPAESPPVVHEFELQAGRVVQLRELTGAEFESLFKALGNDAGNLWELTQAGLRRSLVRDGDDELTYAQLSGAQLAARYGARQLLLLRQAWESIHLPTTEDQARVRAMRAVVA